MIVETFPETSPCKYAKPKETFRETSLQDINNKRRFPVGVAFVTLNEKYNGFRFRSVFTEGMRFNTRQKL